MTSFIRLTGLSAVRAKRVHHGVEVGAAANRGSVVAVNPGVVEFLHVDHDTVLQRYEGGGVPMATRFGKDWDFVCGQVCELIVLLLDWLNLSTCDEEYLRPWTNLSHSRAQKQP